MYKRKGAGERTAWEKACRQESAWRNNVQESWSNNIYSNTKKGLESEGFLKGRPWKTEGLRPELRHFIQLTIGSHGRFGNKVSLSLCCYNKRALIEWLKQERFISHSSGGCGQGSSVVGIGKASLPGFQQTGLVPHPFPLLMHALSPSQALYSQGFI